MDQHDWRRAIGLANELPEQRWDPIGVYHQGDEEQWPPSDYEIYAGWLVEELANRAGVTPVADRLRKAQHRMVSTSLFSWTSRWWPCSWTRSGPRLGSGWRIPQPPDTASWGRDPGLERILAAGAELAPNLVGLPLLRHAASPRSTGITSP